MRLWSLHPGYLDAKGLVALWREGLLAQKVLQGKTKGYRHHPQLDRFKNHSAPKTAIGRYLLGVWEEAYYRGYSFDRGKIKGAKKKLTPISVTKGQLAYEWKHLLKKLKKRDPKRLAGIEKTRAIQSHPSFKVVAGKVESWEKIL